MLEGVAASFSRDAHMLVGRVSPSWCRHEVPVSSITVSWGRLRFLEAATIPQHVALCQLGSRFPQNQQRISPLGTAQFLF